MGHPLHVLEGRFKDIWLDTLREELCEHATIVVVENTPDETYYSDQSIYLVGNHGYFVMFECEHYSNDNLWILMHPSYCTIEYYSQDMVNLEERVHRILDKMSVAFTSKAIEDYENSRWTKFYRLFGWEHVGSLDFAHRKKVEIVEGDFDSEKVKTPSFGSYFSIHCRKEYREDWVERIRTLLDGYATLEIISTPAQKIASPNGRYIFETHTTIKLDVAGCPFFLYGEGHDFDSPESGYFIRTAMTKKEFKQLHRSSTVLTCLDAI